LAIEFDEAVPMPVFLNKHFLEDCGRGRGIRFESLGKLAVNVNIFFERDGQGQNLLFVKALKGSHGIYLS